MSPPPPHLLTSLALLCAIAAASCTPSPRGLTWEVTFAAGVDGREAARVRTTILAGGCNGTTEVYAADVDPASPEGPVPSVLPPGLYGFAATAWSDACVPYADDCENHALPAPEGEVIGLELEDSMASAACPVAQCVSGTCQETPVDAGLDGAGDASADATRDAVVDTGPPPVPLIIGRGVPGEASQTIDLPADAVLVASGTSSFTQSANRGGWVSSRLLIDGMIRGATVTTRRGLVGNQLYAGSALLAPISAGPSTLAHSREDSGYNFVSERWAWTALAASEVISGTRRTAGEVAEVTVTTTDDVIAIVYGVTEAETTDSGAAINLLLDVDGVACGRSTQDDDNAFTVPTVGASFFCLTLVSPGSHLIGARATTSKTTGLETEVGYALVPRGRVAPFGTSGAGPQSVTLPGAGVLLAFAWQRFTGTGGFGEVAVLVDGSTCSRSRTETAPSDLTVGCVWPVTAGATVSVEATGAGEGTTPATATLGWAFLSSDVM